MPHVMQTLRRNKTSTLGAATAGGTKPFHWSTSMNVRPVPYKLKLMTLISELHTYDVICASNAISRYELDYEKLHSP